jgi:hypothetical protein
MEQEEYLDFLDRHPGEVPTVALNDWVTSDYFHMREAFSVEELETIEKSLYNRTQLLLGIVHDFHESEEVRNFANRQFEKVHHVLNIFLAEKRERDEWKRLVPIRDSVEYHEASRVAPWDEPTEDQDG